MTRTPLTIPILMLVATTVDAQPVSLPEAMGPSFGTRTLSSLFQASPVPGSIVAPGGAAASHVTAAAGRVLWGGDGGPTDLRGPSLFGQHIVVPLRTIGSELSLNLADGVKLRRVWFSESARNEANVDWIGLLTEQTRIDVVMHMKRVTEAKTQRELIPGNSDHEDLDKWVNGYREGLRGYMATPARWEDGDGFVTNNISHPVMGGMYTYIYTNNDKRCKDVSYGDRPYWSCIGRAAIYATAASINWEWNPLMSETAIGHVGKARRCVNGACVGEGGFTDFVMTPAGGIAIRIAGDIAQAKLWPLLDRHLSGNTAARIVKVALKVVTAPAHSANCALNMDFKGITSSRHSAGKH